MIKTRWVSIEEELPPFTASNENHLGVEVDPWGCSDVVLVGFNKDGYGLASPALATYEYFKGNKPAWYFVNEADEGFQDQITHWMPIPSLPKTKKGKSK